MKPIECEVQPGQAPPAARPPLLPQFNRREARVAHEPYHSCREQKRQIIAVHLALLASFLAALPTATARSADDDAAPASSAARERIPQGAVLRLLGHDVKGPTGEVVAQLINVLVDEAGQPHAAILDYGGFLGVGRRRIAVAWQVLRFAPGGTSGGTITLDLSRDQLKAFPDYKKGEPIVAAAPPPSGGSPVPSAIPK